MQVLRQHAVVLAEGSLLLRPMTEDDWGTLLKWNSDPEVLYFSEGDDVSARSLGEVQGIYRGVARAAFCFVVELDGVPIGEGWLQRMNLPHLLDRFPGQDLRRIDLMIGEKQHWGRGLGTRIIALLTRFGFEQERADAIFGCSVADYNPRSRRAFEKNGYRVVNTTVEPPGRKARECYDLMLTREEYAGRRTAQAPAA